MARLPFDPQKIKSKSDPDKPAPLTVTQIGQQIRTALNRRFDRPVQVVGEVSNFTDRGHWFWTLKDEQSVLGCVMWRSTAQRSDHRLEDGQQVVVTGRIDYYGPQGRLQLYADRVEAAGSGPLELRFRQLCRQLRQAGYFDEDRKKAPPAFPVHVAVITSAGGAAWHDVVRTAQNRWAGIRLSLIDVRVQGESAAGQIAKAIESVDRHRTNLGIDAVLLTRGGGSLEDLWAFNEPVVAEAIYRARTPIVAAVGHETDLTIAELVADVRCSTPTQAAMFLIPEAEAQRQQLDQWARRLTHRTEQTIQQHRSALLAAYQRLPKAMGSDLQSRHLQLNRCETQMARIEPAGRIRIARLQWQQALQRLCESGRHRLDRCAAALDAAGRQLEAMGPNSVLRRGFSYTTDASGKPLRSVRSIKQGDRIVTHLQDGTIDSNVKKTTSS
ncbi:MAG: exodeoxyribonuclease VII large subunit [Phycisphaeraceae bacterium]|nr:exodeoxyribonuclease VII large subunit [Phycisphaeraceae bacterium]